MKLMRLMRKCKGSISVFLCLILLPMVTYAALIIDASRLQSARVAVATAGDLTMNAAMSEYEQVLEDMYGIFAVAKTEEELKDSLKAYYKQTIESSLIGSEAEDEYVQQLSDEIVEMIFSEDGFDYDNFLQMQLGDFKYEPVAGTALANPAVMKRQIIDYMKYKGPVSVVSTLMPKLDFLKDSSKQTEVLSKKVEYTEKLYSLNDPCTKAYNAITGSVENNVRQNDGYNDYAESFNNLVTNTPIKTALDNVRSNFKLMSECDLMYKNSYFSVSANKLSFDSLWEDSGGQTDIDSIYAPDTNLDEMTKDELKAKLGEISSAYSEIVSLELNSSGGSFSEYIDEVRINENNTDNSSKLASTYTVTITKKSSGAYPSLANIGSEGSWIKALDVPDASQGKADIDALRNRYNFQQSFSGLGRKELLEFAEMSYQLLKYEEIYDEVFAKYDELVRQEIEDDINYDDQDIIDSYLEDDKDYYNCNYVEIYNNKKKMDAVNTAIYNNNYYSRFNNFLTKLNDCSVYDTYGNVYCNNAMNILENYYSPLYNSEAKLVALSRALGEIQYTLLQIKQAKDFWQDSIDGLGSQSSTKASMQSDLDSTTENFDKEDVAALEKVAEERRSQVNLLIDQIESVKYLDLIVVVLYNHDIYASSSYYDPYIFSEEQKADQSLNTWQNAESQAEEMVSQHFDRNGVNENDFVPLDLIDGQKPNGEKDEDERFFPILKSICEPEQGKQLSEDDQKSYDNSQEFSKVDKDGLPETNTDSSTPPASSESSEQEEQKPKAKANLGDILDDIKGYKSGLSTDASQNQLNGNYKVSAPTITIDDDGEVEGNPSTSLNNATSLLSKLADLRKSVRDNVYLEEYFTEMFTCQTDAKLDSGKLVLLSGYTNADSGDRIINKNTEWYGNEIEYILWGDSTLKNNRTKTEALIYTIRFALNAVYAFTASDIQTFAFEAASALVGWTVVGVPIVQACITIGIALAESALDLQALKDGQDVPIYKNSTTFKCSPSGALNEITDQFVHTAAQYVGDKVDQTIDEITDKAYERIGDAIGDIQKYVNDFVDKQAEGVKSAIEQQFVTPAINSITPLLAEVQNGASNANDLVNEAVETTFKSIEENINAINDGPTKDLILQFYREHKDDIKSKFVEQISAYLKAVIDGTDSGSLRDKITGVIDDKIGKFQDTINAKMDEYKNSIMQKVRDACDKPIGDLKNFLHETMNDFADDLSGKISDAITDNVTKQLDTGSASNSFTLNYKEYCKIFILINLIGNETAMLQRAGALMQVNVQNAVNGANPEFELINANTMVSVSADVKMSTLMPWTVSDNVDETTGENGMKMDFSHLGENQVTIHYNGMFGY